MLRINHNKREIIEYYVKSDWLYKFFWYGKNSLGLHFGIDDSKTKTLDDAVVNQYKIIIKEGKIKKGMRVLDAGCGIGGAAMYVAKNTMAEVIGISIVKKQIELANLKGRQLQDKFNLRFECQDYEKTNFPNNYFDVIYGIESICYGYPKELFLKEARRILKRGGRLIISDGYKIREPVNLEELKIEKDFCRGWKLKEIINIDEMESKIENTGFKISKKIDVTKKLGLSIKRFNWLWRIGSLAMYLPGVKDNVLAIKNVLAGIRRKMFGYYVIVAVKN